MEFMDLCPEYDRPFLKYLHGIRPLSAMRPKNINCLEFLSLLE